MRKITQNKKGMTGNLVAVGYGIVALAILVGVGVVVLDKFGNTTGGSSNTTVQYLITQLGSSGLAGWVPAVIALTIGVLFLSYFMGRKKGY